MAYRFLFAAHPTVGHTNALVSIARRMIAGGDEALFSIAGSVKPPRFRVKPEVLDASLRLPSAIQGRGVPVAPLRAPLSTFWHAALLPRERGYAELRRAMAIFTAGAAGYARQIRALLLRFPADVIVADYTFFGAWLAADLARVPFVAAYHSGLPFPVPGGPPFGSGLPLGSSRDARWDAAAGELAGLERLVDDRLNRARVALGLPRVAPGILTRPYAPSRNLLFTHPALEPPRGELGPRVEYVGPCIDPRRDDTPFPWERLEEGSLRVYVSMGTVFNDDPEAFATILHGLEGPGVQLIVSAGGSHDALLRRSFSPSTLILRRVPQLQLLPRVDVVVGHGGNNSTNEALAAGKPLIVVPFGAEQIDNAARVASLGAGVQIDRARLDQEAVRAALQRLRVEPSFAERARGIAEALRGVDGIEAAAASLREIAGARRGPGG